MLFAGYKFPIAFLAMLGVVALSAVPARAQRSYGIDVSAWQGSISTTEWSNLRNVNNQEFVFIRSSRGGTTGYYNQGDSDNSDGLNTLSQRYDDPFFVQNITRATNAGLLAGPYHFARPDIVASTQNSGGIANSGTDEANHFLQMAGAWMRPGYILPVFDLEAGEGIRTDTQLNQFSIDFSNRIFEVTSVRPIMYINGNYTANVAQPGLDDYFPVLWVARYVDGNNNPDPSYVATIHPKDTYAGFYGPWDDAPAPTHPWSFWQYASTGRLSGYRNGTVGIDVNVANGGTEFLRDTLVPALWTNSGDGNWSTLANWNSGQTPVAPVQGPGQVARVGSLTLPTARLPGSLDTVILDRSAQNVTVTLDAGTHNIRKLVTREALNINGGSLTVNYTPVAESTPYSVLVSSAVSLTGGSLTAHTLQVEPTRTLTLGGGTLTFDTLNLMPGTSVGAGMAILGDVTLAPRNDATAKIQLGAGFGFPSVISLGDAARTINVVNGAADVDVSIDTAIVSGSIEKTGPGTLRLSQSNSQSGTTVTAGKLLVTNTTGSATGGAPVMVGANGVLGGTGTMFGMVTIAGELAPGLSIGTINVGSLVMQSGSSLSIEIGSAASYDRVAVGGGVTIDSGAAIDVAFASGFTPTFGQSYSILTAGGAVTGAFGEVNTNGPAMVARNVAGGVVLELLSGLAGDFNNDGAVNAADYTLWASNVGSPASVLLNAGEAQTVDAALYTVWRDNEGTTLPATASAVPEPTAALLTLCGLASLARNRR
jgi:autotransporter-associated beta strand protein